MTARTRLLAALALVTPLGLVTKFVLPDCLPGAAGRWCLLYGAAVLYEVFWVLVLLAAAPRISPVRSVAIVLVATCVLEFAQLWHPAWLNSIRSTWLGAAVLGTGFDWWDFPHYVIGCALGWLVAVMVCRVHPE